MEQPVTWDQLIEAAEDQDTADRRPGHPGRGADGVAQRPHRVRRRAHHRGDGRRPGGHRSSASTAEAGQAAAEVMNGVATQRGRRPGVLDRRRGRQRHRLRRGRRRLHGQLAVRLGPRPGRGRGRHARRSRCPTTTAGRIYPRVVEGEPSAPPYGGINLGVGAFSENVDVAYEAAECIVSEENQAYYFIEQRQPGGQGVGLRRPRGHRGLPAGAGHPGVAGDGRARDRRPSTTARSPAALQREYHPPTAVDPETTGQAADDLISAVLAGEQLL